MKKLFFLFTALLFLTACSSENVIATVSTTEAVEGAQLQFETEPVSGVSFSYRDLQYTDFLFSSGAGGWGTTLHIEADGSFSGIYHDSEMGDTGAEYPHGTVYYCDFYGQFGAPEKISDRLYSLPIQVLRYGHVPDSQQIMEQQRYCYTTALGIEGTQSLLLYSPGTPLEDLPMEYRQWVGLHNSDEGQLPFWGLYNEAQQCGFSSSNRIQNARDAIVTAEEVEVSINSLLNEYSTQADMNIAAQQRYIVWDDALNSLWIVLKQVTPKDTMQQLTKEQLAWIDEKEQTAADAAAPFQDGSLYPTVYYSAAADMTKERVYTLLSYLP